MPRSSDSIAALASALAKAQAELVNPDKSLTATIPGTRPGERDLSFRYAPLSSGLDIVRRTLGKHEIATVQTTAIDPQIGMVKLTTMLAHASGEWIASDWPICPVAETANPQRMGAALTYARRYALFTLVGIAGEDDLDAPDLCAPAPAASGGEYSLSPRREQSRAPLQTPGNGHGRSATKGGHPIVLAAGPSAAVRKRLLAEMDNLPSGDLAASWARQALVDKNSLTATDAKLVEDAFEKKLSELSSSGIADRPTNDAPVPDETAASAVDRTVAADGPETGEHDGVDKSVLSVAAPRRYRNRDHLRHLAKQPCLICGRKPSDPHHLRFAQPRALGRKASDEFAVPLCRIHHRLVHRVGNEAAWWKDAGIDPIKVARKFWEETCIRQGRTEPGQPAQAVPADQSSKVDDLAADARA